MKKIYLRVELPDGIKPEVIDVGYQTPGGNFEQHRIYESEFTEIQLPSEEEIRDSAEKKYPKRDSTKFLQQWDNTLRRLYVEAQMELLNKLKGE